MSFLAAQLFLQQGFNIYGVYMIAGIIKIMGFVFSVLIERIFYAKRMYFLKNLGLSYRRIFTYIFLLDLGYYAIILTGCWMIRNFI